MVTDILFRYDIRVLRIIIRHKIAFWTAISSLFSYSEGIFLAIEIEDKGVKVEKEVEVEGILDIAHNQDAVVALVWKITCFSAILEEFFQLLKMRYRCRLLFAQSLLRINQENKVIIPVSHFKYRNILLKDR